MQTLQQPEVQHSIESAGVDWITATANHGNTRSDMMAFSRSQRNRMLDAGYDIKQAYRLGYTGFESEGFFYGNREGGSIIIASGALAHLLHRSIYHVADNVSRLDLQVTVSTPIDRPNLALQAYSVLKRNPPCRVRVRHSTHITSSPKGDTLNVNKRSSETYARLYDKASESGEGPPRTRWRYEVEHKRNRAYLVAGALCGRQSGEVVAREVVYDYFDARGVAPIFARNSSSRTETPVLAARNTRVLDWFRDSLSITVAKAIKAHGLAAVLDALCISALVAPVEERSE